MADMPFSSAPEFRPRRVTRTTADEVLRRVNHEFTPDEIMLSTRYPIPRGQRRTVNNPSVTARARTLDDLLNDASIQRVVPGGTDVVLTNLTLEATNSTRKIEVEMTNKRVSALIESTDRDWMQGRCDDLHAVLEGDYPSWALWRSSRRRGFLGLALDTVAAATGWIILGDRLLHPLAAALAFVVLVAIPTLCCQVGNRFVHRCHIRIGASDPSWFWQRWSVRDKLAFTAIVVTILLTLGTQLLTATTSTDGHQQPTRAPNPTATDRELR
jgi:hypothetical protein